MSPLIIGLIMAGIGLLTSVGTSIYNNSSQSKINQQLIDSNEKINQQNIEAAQKASDLDYQRNSMSNQVSQMRQAGLNPQLMSGSSFVPSSTEVPKLSPVSGLNPLRFSDPSKSMVDSFTSVLGSLDSHNLSSQESALKAQQSIKTMAEIENLHKDGKISDEEYKRAKIYNDNLQRQLDDSHDLAQSQVNRNASEIQLINSQIPINEKTLSKLDSEINLNIKRAELTDEQSKQIYAETNLKLPLLLQELRARIHKIGLENEQLAALKPSEYGSLLSQRLQSEINRIDANTAQIVTVSALESDNLELQILGRLIGIYNNPINSGQFFKFGDKLSLADELEKRFNEYFGKYENK